MINVCWYEKAGEDVHARSGYGVLTMLNNQFDLYNCVHWNTYDNFPKDADGGVFVLHGGNLAYGLCPGSVELINEQVKHLKWVIFIVACDEECAFESWKLSHRNSLLWLQSPRVELTADRFFPVGFPTDCLGMIAKYRAEPKDLDWFFAGQVTHERRQQCFEILIEMASRGIVIPTSGFGQGLNHDTYFHHMCRARVVPCPSGPETPDTYRVYEALEAGAVPVVDAVSPKGGLGYWEKVFGEHPLPVVADWADFPIELDIILADWARKQKEVSKWWKSYVLNWNLSLAKDVERLRGPA